MKKIVPATLLCWFIAMGSLFSANTEIDHWPISCKSLQQRTVAISQLDFIAENSRSDLFVIVFLGTDCPISQKYMHTLREMYNSFNVKVEFFGIVPKNFSEKQISEFGKAYQVPFQLIHDNDNFYAHLFGAKVTPEAFLFDDKGIIYYDGAIDNWFFALGRNRLKPTEHYLEDALVSVLSGELIETAHEQAIGCLIEMKH